MLADNFFAQPAINKGVLARPSLPMPAHGLWSCRIYTSVVALASCLSPINRPRGTRSFIPLVFRIAMASLVAD
jgi:hypothetical protein